MKKTFPSLLVFIVIITCSGILCAAGTDPTRPPSEILQTKSENSEQLPSPQRLTAIFNYPNYRLAVIDNHIVKQGDHLGEYVVTTIKKNGVELTGSKNKRIMLMLSPTVKQLR